MFASEMLRSLQGAGILWRVGIRMGDLGMGDGY